MEALQFHQQQHLPMFLTPISFSNNFRATTSLCFRYIISKCFSASFSSLTTPTGATTRKELGKIRARTTAISSVVADGLKENWLASLSCPPFVPETENPLLKLEEGLGDGEAPLSNVGSQWVIGIDPDVSGALAVLRTDDSGSSAQVFDSPNLKVLVGKRIRRRLDTNALVQLLLSFEAPAGTTAYIEQSLPYPSDGKQGWWSAGFNYGLWIGVLVASKFSVVPVPSARWKNEFKLAGNGSTKNDSRELACTLFPSLSSSLKRKKDHGRAEALLIAAYGKGIKRTS